jgi:hypothetical protein
MSKKNVALIVLIVCFLTIMVIAVFGNSAVTGIIKNVTSVSLCDSDGNNLELHYFLGDKEVIRKVDELESVYYEFADTKQALNSDEEKKIFSKYIVEIEYRESDVVEIDSARYIVYDFYALVNPGDATYPKLTHVLNAYMKESLAQRVDNVTTNKDGEEVDYLQFKVDDENSALVPFASKLNKVDEEEKEIQYIAVHYRLYIEFAEYGDYDPFVTEGEGSFKEAVREACISRDGSVDFELKIDKDNSAAVKIPDLTFKLDYQETDEEKTITTNIVIIK